MRFLILIFLFFTLGLASQDYDLKTELDRPAYMSPRIGISATGFLNFYGHAISVTTEFPLSYNWRLEGELGYIYDASSVTRFDGETHRGLRARLGGKYCFGNKLYLKANFKYNRTKTFLFDEGLRQGANYQEWLLTERNFHTVGGLFAGGADLPLSRNERLVLDFSIGLGVVHFEPIDPVPFPDDFDFFSDNFFIWNEFRERFTGIDLSISLQLEFVLARK